MINESVYLRRFRTRILFRKHSARRDWIYVDACKVLFNLKLNNFDRLVTGTVLLLRGVNLNERCSWCHYLSCVPTSKWSCEEQRIYCEVSSHFSRNLIPSMLFPSA
jgi:hypothetical protein